MKKEDLIPTTPRPATNGAPPLFGDHYEYQDGHFVELANTLLREHIYPLVHEHTRQLMHEGHPCVLRHLVDSHLSTMEVDPAGIKLFVAKKGADRHDFEARIHNRDFIRPTYFAVIADPIKKTIELEYYRGDQRDEKISYYEKRLPEFDVNRVRLGLLKFSEAIP